MHIPIKNPALSPKLLSVDMARLSSSQRGPCFPSSLSSPSGPSLRLSSHSSRVIATSLSPKMGPLNHRLTAGSRSESSTRPRNVFSKAPSWMSFSKMHKCVHYPNNNNIIGETAENNPLSDVSTCVYSCYLKDLQIFTETSMFIKLELIEYTRN